MNYQPFIKGRGVAFWRVISCWGKLYEIAKVCSSHKKLTWLWKNDVKKINVTEKVDVTVKKIDVTVLFHRVQLEWCYR